jgi:hypothetical protein
MSNAKNTNVTRFEGETALARIADLEAKIAAMSAPSEKDTILVAMLDKAISALGEAAKPRKAVSRAVSTEVIDPKENAFLEACRAAHLSPRDDRGRILRYCFDRGNGTYTVREIVEETGQSGDSLSTIAGRFTKVSGHGTRYAAAGFEMSVVNDRGAFLNGVVLYRVRDGFYMPGLPIPAETETENKSA